MVPADEAPAEGRLHVTVEPTTLSSPDMRQGRYNDMPSFLTDQASICFSSPTWEHQILSDLSVVHILKLPHHYCVLSGQFAVVCNGKFPEVMQKILQSS